MNTNVVRSSNFEALRIVCMLLIVAGHMTMWHDFQSDTVNRYVHCAIMPFFCVAVNCFVLISGWFGIKFKPDKIFSLNNTLTFWVLLICAITLFIGFHEINIKKDILLLVPLVTKKYWFITVYVALCLLAPYLNILVNALSKEDFRKLLVTCICLFVALPTLGAIFNFESITLDSGYGIVNFTVLYLTGRYMRLYKNPKRHALIYLGIYFVMMACCGLFQVLYSKILGFEFTTLMSYDTFFVFFGAIALFCSFSRLNFANKYINLLATSCFVVYVIHMHNWIGSWIFNNFFGLRNLDDHWFLLSIPIIPVVTYLGCFMLEQARVKGYKLIRKITPPRINSN